MQDLTGKTLQDLIDMLEPKANDPRRTPRDPTTETEPKGHNRQSIFSPPKDGLPCSR